MSEAQAEWLKRVLGIELGPPGAASAPISLQSLTKARIAWRDAIEEVDGQIAALAQELRASDDEDLHDIADTGLNALTGDHKVKLMASLIELSAGTPAAIAKTAPKAVALAQAFRKHLETDERVAACDEAPLKSPPSIRATLIPALTALEAALTTR